MKEIETKTIINTLKYYKSNSAYSNRIQELGLFGSFASSTNIRASDIDIFLRLKPIRMFDLIGIKEDLEKLFHKKVDLVVIRKSMNPYLKKQIEKSGLYVWQRFSEGRVDEEHYSIFIQQSPWKY